MRSVIVFILCFALGATIALVVRAAFHHPYAPAMPVAKP